MTIHYFPNQVRSVLLQIPEHLALLLERDARAGGQSLDSFNARNYEAYLSENFAEELAAGQGPQLGLFQSQLALKN